MHGSPLQRVRSHDLAMPRPPRPQTSSPRALSTLLPSRATSSDRTLRRTQGQRPELCFVPGLAVPIWDFLFPPTGQSRTHHVERWSRMFWTENSYRGLSGVQGLWDGRERERGGRGRERRSGGSKSRHFVSFSSTGSDSSTSHIPASPRDLHRRSYPSPSLSRPAV